MKLTGSRLGAGSFFALCPLEVVPASWSGRARRSLGVTVQGRLGDAPYRGVGLLWGTPGPSLSRTQRRGRAMSEIQPATPTASVEVRRWTDPPEPGCSADDWPYPDEHVEYLITGNLADLIRARTGETGDVYFEEVAESGGYSEWTQETDYHVTVRVGQFEREFFGSAEFDSVYAYYSALPTIQRWLERDDD